MVGDKQAGQRVGQRRLFRTTQVIVMIAAAALLVAHAAKWESVRVDAVTLALLGFLLVVPLAELIRKVKIGDFEPEIGRDEVARVQAKAALELTPTGDGDVPISADRIRGLLQEDPRLALAKVRIELEEGLKRLYDSTGKSEPQSRRLSLGRLVDHLVRTEVLPPHVAGALRDVIALANRAVHGEPVEPRAAEDLALLGIRLIREVQHLTFERALRPSDTAEITPADAEAYQGAMYRVTTVVPLAEHPVRNTYVLDQQGLDAFLEGYHEYGEFLVAIETVSP